MPNVCFPCATLQDADTGRIALYYGCADSYVGLAFTTVDEWWITSRPTITQAPPITRWHPLSVKRNPLCQCFASPSLQKEVLRPLPALARRKP